jgi:putative oxidoreductase
MKGRKMKIDSCHAALSQFQWLPALMTRVTVGLVFVESGWGKLHHLERVTEYFTSLGIPFPALQAPFVAGVEVIGGAMLLVGLASRWAAIPLIATMVVAIMTAKMADITGLTDIFGFSEFLYIVLLVWVLIFGSGFLSLDRILSLKFKRWS